MCYFFYFCYMSKGRYNYYDPEYDPQVTEGNELLLMINDETFSFVVLQTDTKKVLVWGEEFNCEELQNPADLRTVLNANYNDVKAIVTSPDFTIIPKDLFDSNYLDEYSRFLTLDANDVLQVNELDSISNVVFKVNQATMQTLKNRVSDKSIFFSGKVFASAITFGRHDNANLYAHIDGNKLQLLYFKNALLSFYNSFEFNNPDELMYFIVLTANELDLNLDETSIMLSGDVNISDKKIHRVSDLLPKVYLNQTRIVLLPQGFLPHQILLLSGLTLCASLVEN